MFLSTCSRKFFFTKDSFDPHIVNFADRFDMVSTPFFINLILVAFVVLSEQLDKFCDVRKTHSKAVP